MDTLYQLSDEYHHPLSTELLAVHFYQICYDATPNKELLAHVVTILANKLSQDHHGYFSLRHIKHKYKTCFQLEQEILFNYSLTYPPLLRSVNTKKNLCPSFRYLLRLTTTTHLPTFLLAVKLLRHTPLIQKIIKYSRLYRFFKLLAEDLDIHVKELIEQKNKIS